MSESRVILYTDDGEAVTFYVVAQTMLGSINYLLVTDEEEGDADCYILKETGTNTEESFYEAVEDEVELDAIYKIFTELLEDDEDIELQ